MFSSCTYITPCIEQSKEVDVIEVSDNSQVPKTTAPATPQLLLERAETWGAGAGHNWMAPKSPVAQQYIEEDTLTDSEDSDSEEHDVGGEEMGEDEVGEDEGGDDHGAVRRLWDDGSDINEVENKILGWPVKESVVAAAATPTESIVSSTQLHGSDSAPILMKANSERHLSEGLALINDMHKYLGTQPPTHIVDLANSADKEGAAGSNPKKVQEGQKKGAEVDDDRVQTQTPEPWYTAITDTFAQQFLLLQQPPVAHAIGTQMLHGMHFEIVKQYQVGGHSDKK
jgi:hypothetical protein